MDSQAQVQFDRAAAIGEVILKAREVETLLHAAAGGEVTGIHALTELLGDKLPEELKRQLHYIGSVRNQAAHEAEFEISFADFSAFERAANEALDTLNRLFPDAAQGGAEAQPEAVDVEVEKDALKNLAHRFHIFGFFPLIGVLNLFRILLECIWAQLGVLVLILFYLASVPLLIDGVRRYGEKPELLYAGIIAAAAVYVITLIVSWCNKTLKMPKFIVWVPGLDIIYLVTLFAQRLLWGKFLISAAGIIALTVAFCAVLGQRWELAAYALGAEWLFSVIASLAFPPPKPENEQ